MSGRVGTTETLVTESCNDVEAQRPQDAHDPIDNTSRDLESTDTMISKAASLIASPYDTLIYVLFAILLAYHIIITQVWNTSFGPWTNNSIAQAYFNNVTDQNIIGDFITFWIAALLSAMFRRLKLSWGGRRVLELLSFLFFLHLSKAYNASYVRRYPGQGGTCASSTKISRTALE